MNSTLRLLIVALAMLGAFTDRSFVGSGDLGSAGLHGTRSAPGAAALNTRGLGGLLDNACRP
jgi:hypothetical protein